MTVKPAGPVQRRPRRADESRMLREDVAAMIAEARLGRRSGSDRELAHDIIVVVRERVLQELASYARENIR